MATKINQKYGITLSKIEYVPLTKLKFHPFNKFFKVETSSYFDTLRDSIKDKGVLVPLIAKKDGTILCGHNRLLTVKVLWDRADKNTKKRFEKLPVQYVLDPLSESEERKLMVEDNTIRRHFTKEQRIKLYRQLYPEFDKRIYISSKGKASGGKEAIALTAEKISLETGMSLKTVAQDLSSMRKETQKNAGISQPGVIDPSIVKSTKMNLAYISAKLLNASYETHQEVFRILKTFTQQLSVQMANMNSKSSSNKKLASAIASKKSVNMTKSKEAYK